MPSNPVAPASVPENYRRVIGWPISSEVAVPRDLFAAILERIQRFGVPPPLVQRG